MQASADNDQRSVADSSLTASTLTTYRQREVDRHSREKATSTVSEAEEIHPKDVWSGSLYLPFSKDGMICSASRKQRLPRLRSQRVRPSTCYSSAVLIPMYYTITHIGRETPFKVEQLETWRHLQAVEVNR